MSRYTDNLTATQMADLAQTAIESGENALHAFAQIAASWFRHKAEPGTVIGGAIMRSRRAQIAEGEL